jgi:hypothetical protein
MRIVLIFLSLILGSFAPPETPAVYTLKYKIKHDGKDIGDVKATRLIQDGKITYEVQTNMNIRLLGSQKVAYYSKAVYQNGILHSSIARSYLNDKQHQSCVTTLKNRYYEVKKDKDTRTFTRAVNYSGSLLYFAEPTGHQLVYSEMSGQDNGLKKAGEGYYVLTDAKSKKQNKYWYRGGVLEKAAIKHTFIDIEVHRVH